MHLFPFTKTRAALALAAALFSFSSFSAADTITVSTSAVPQITLGPSSDSLSWNASSGVFDPAAGVFTFQTGDFNIGDSEIPDQVIPFSFQDTITLNGTTQTLTIFGQDSVTSAADTLDIFAANPVSFGNVLFSVKPLEMTAASLGDYPLELQASVTDAAPIPEPSSLVLLGTGLFAGAGFLLFSPIPVASRRL